MSAVRTVLERFELTTRRHRLIKKGDRLLTAVSGGPDSMALLGLLLLLKKKYSLSLAAAHLHHGLQSHGNDALRLSKKACKDRGVTFVWEKADVRSLARKRKLSLEDAARTARYDFLARAAKKTRSAKIVTAHTLDDQAETVLMRLLRGSGIRGLAGIPYERAEKGRRLIRPLLDIQKKELTAFARELKLPFTTDPMNRDPRFLRGRIRHELLPYLKRFNPRVEEALSGLRSAHADLRGFLEGRAAAAYRRIARRVSKKEIRLAAAPLKRLAGTFRNETLLRALSELKGDGAGFGFNHVLAIADLILSGKNGSAHLPHGVRAQLRGDFLYLRLS